MSLHQCLQARGLANAARPGLQALGANSQRVTMTAASKAVCSVNLDRALAQQCPNDPRWDFGVEWRRGPARGIAWLEVHPASSSEVATVLDKLRWLKDWLRNAAAECTRLPSSYHWIATNAGVHIDSARRRRLNAAGLRMPQSRLRL